MDAVRRRPSKLGGYKRNRQGCLTCRRRKKKCVPDGDSQPRDRCAHCIRLNLHCVWEQEQDLAPATPTQEHDVVVVKPRSPRPPPSPWRLLNGADDDGTDGPLHRRMAMRYYVQSFAGTLSTNAENNGFLSVLLPMAMESGPLLDALVAWSSSHLALQQDGVLVKALEDRSKALRSFASGLQSLPRETAVAICLILTSMEAILGSTSDWYHHLAAAATIIKTSRTKGQDDDRTTSSFERTAEGRWLLRNFAYHDILASVSLGRGLLLPDLDWLCEEQSAGLDTYLGLGCVPVAYLGQIRALSCELEAANLVVTDPSTAGRSKRVNEIALRLADIEASLRTWQPPTTDSEPLVALAEIYRCAALICLYRLLRYYRLTEATNLTACIDTQVEAVIQHMARMPAGCLPECTLLFPLFIAGGETMNAEHQKAIGDRMIAIVQGRNFENVRVGLDVLKEVWDVKARTMPNDETRPYDWSNVLGRRNWHLALS